MATERGDPSSPPACLSEVSPSRTALLELLRPKIDDSMLAHIASCDAPWEASENLSALRGIRDKGAIPSPLGWNPGEVLSLMASTQPGDSDGWNEAGRRGHLMRSFCRAALLVAGGDPANAGNVRFDDERHNLVLLLEGLRNLDGPFPKAFLRTLAWRVVEAAPEWNDRPLFAFALLLLCVQLGLFVGCPRHLSEIAAWVNEEEEGARTRIQPLFADGLGPFWPRFEEWLTGLSISGCRDGDAWQRLARAILVDGDLPYPDETASELRALGRKVGVPSVPPR